MNQKGFTLVEILVSVAIFALIVTAAIGAILAMIDASQKARSMSSAMTNLNIALETMAREIRVGSQYGCTDGTVNGSAPCSSITFRPADSTNGSLAKYSLNGNRITVCRGACGAAQPITAPEVIIEALEFYVSDDGTNTNVDGDGDLRTNPPLQSQPHVLMRVRGKVSERSQTESTFYIQTLMTQRVLGTRFPIPYPFVPQQP